MKKITNLLFTALFFLCACAQPEDSEQGAANSEDKQTDTQADVVVAPELISSEVVVNKTKKAESTEPLASFKFSKKSHDFGDIKQGDIVKHQFEFINTGQIPLIISSTRASCGCTTPKYPKDKPIAPGEVGDITVQFNSTGKTGVQNKTVTIYANVAGGSDAITIKANIVKSIEGPLKKYAN